MPMKARRNWNNLSIMKILLQIVLCLTALVPAIATGNGCNSVVIDFDTSPPGGAPLVGGDYLSNEWYNAYGLMLSATGGLSNKPRLFDTSHPGTTKLGDPDLGTPNQRCSGGGPGVGEGGEPKEPGENCEPLGNVLIIQEDNDHPEVPDDNVDGGTMTFKFDDPVRVTKIGLLDIDYKSYLTVKTSNSGSFDIPIPMLGDNSVQTVDIGEDNVVELDVNLRRSGAVTYLSFCYDEVDLGRIGDVCTGDGTCDTDYCFNAVLPDGAVPAGVCSCNPETNAGCDDPAECSFSPLGDIGPPECLLPIGEICTGGGICTTGFCFNAILPDGTRPAGVCSCDPSSNAGCEGSEVCTDSPSEDIGPPECLLPIGEVCEGGDVCTTGYCFNAVLPDGTIPAGVCSCDPSTNAGCKEEGEECSFSPLVDIGPPGCFLPLGATCSIDSQCLSDNCFEGRCVCNEDLNFPCADNEVCTFQEGHGYACLLKIGEPCNGGCETDYCFNAILPGGALPVGVCSCNPTTNAGCEDPTECAFSPLVEVGPPDCFLPMESACSGDSECLSDHCFEDRCVCNEDLNFPCADNEVCTFVEGNGFVCLLKIGEVCSGDDTCETDYCFNAILPDGTKPAGVCSCNPETNAGCFEPEVCADSPLDEIGPPRCLHGVGAPCFDDDSCTTGYCFDVNPPDATQPVGICSCDPETNAGCEDPAECSFSPLGDIGPPECLLPIGSECSANDECETGSCYIDPLLPPRSPGFCVCNTETNQGCKSDFICGSSDDLAVATGIFDSSPACKLPVDAICTNDESCLTNNCDEGICTCNVDTHWPCNTDDLGERCLLDLTGRFVCLLPNGVDCGEHSDCASNFCDYRYGPNYPGVCSCNTDTGEGCPGDLKCSDLSEERGITGGFIDCYLHTGDLCNEDSECLSGLCDDIKGWCACNQNTNYPCDTENGEKCLLEDGSYICKVFGDGEIGDECVEDSDCVTNQCFNFNPVVTWTCTCNTETNAGCPGDLKCSDLLAEQGVLGGTPKCYLHTGDHCVKDTGCLSGYCNKAIGQCGCNTDTDYPCDTTSGERCAQDFDGNYVCIAPGDGSLGSDCFEDSDCDSMACAPTLLSPEDVPGYCSCNVDTNDGCDGDFVCFSGLDILEAQLLYDSGPRCLLPVGTPCTPGSAGDCITYNCDEVTKLCTCNTETNYPCASGETCGLNRYGKYICKH